jgi:RNA polymerase sigma-70 factor (family 1)
MSKSTACNEKFLAQQLLIGNEKAFKKLFDAYRNDLYKFSLSMVYSEPYAEEIVQEVFLNLWLKRKTTNPELSMKSYLFTITRNKTISFLKKAANNKKLREEIFYRSQKSVNSTERYMREEELKTVKKEALDLLSPRRRLIFEMSRNDGKSYKEIARELGISQNTVKNQMSMALEILREFLRKNRDMTLALLFFIEIGSKIINFLTVGLIPLYALYSLKLSNCF